MKRRGARAGGVPTSWSFEARVAAPPEAVYAWMSDYREDDHAREAFRRGAGVKPGDTRVSHRRIVSREGNRVVLEDSWGRQRFPMEVELRPSAHELHLTGQYGYRGTWSAKSDGAGGAIVRSEGRVEPTGIMKLFAPLFARAFMKQMKADFEGHVAEMREDLERR